MSADSPKSVHKPKPSHPGFIKLLRELGHLVGKDLASIIEACAYNKFPKGCSYKGGILTIKSKKEVKSYSLMGLTSRETYAVLVAAFRAVGNLPSGTDRAIDSKRSLFVENFDFARVSAGTKRMLLWNFCKDMCAGLGIDLPTFVPVLFSTLMTGMLIKVIDPKTNIHVMGRKIEKVENIEYDAITRSFALELSSLL
jgi:hypothetical protein